MLDYVPFGSHPVAPDGRNPITHDCKNETGRCWNLLFRPKIEELAQYLPGKLAFGDCDAMVEVNGYFLFLEFKNGKPGELLDGQHLMWRRLTESARNMTVGILACASTREMDVHAIRVCRGGIFYPWGPATADSFRRRIKRWGERAHARRRFKHVA